MTAPSEHRSDGVKSGVPFVLVGPFQTGIEVSPEVFLRDQQWSETAVLSAVTQACGPLPQGFVSLTPPEPSNWSSLRDFEKNRWVPRFLLRAERTMDLPQLPSEPGMSGTVDRVTLTITPHDVGTFTVRGTAFTAARVDAMHVGQYVDGLADHILQSLRDSVTGVLRLLQTRIALALGLDQTATELVAITPERLPFLSWAHRVFWFDPSVTAGHVVKERGFLHESAQSRAVEIAEGRVFYVGPGRSHYVAAYATPETESDWESALRTVELQEAWQLAFMTIDRQLFEKLNETSRTEDGRHRSWQDAEQELESMARIYDKTRRFLSIVNDERRYFDSAGEVSWRGMDEVWRADSQRAAVATKSAEVLEKYKRTVDALRLRGDRRVQVILTVFTAATFTTLFVALVELTQGQPLELPTGGRLIAVIVLAAVDALVALVSWQLVRR